jgi:uncharacterized protein with PhoU and TrkA domain
VILQLFDAYCVLTTRAANRTRSIDDTLDPARVIEIKNAIESIVEGAREVAPSLRGKTLDESTKVILGRLQLRLREIFQRVAHKLISRGSLVGFQQSLYLLKLLFDDHHLDREYSLEH